MSTDSYGQFVFDQWLLDFLFMIFSIGIPGIATRYLASAPERWFWGMSPLKLIARMAAVSWTICLVGFFGYQVFSKTPLTSTAALTFFGATYLFNSFLTPILQGLMRFKAVLVGNLTFAAVAPLFSLAVVRYPGLVSTGAALGLAFALSSAVATWQALRAPPLVRAASAQKPSGAVAYALNIWIIGLIANLVWSRGEIAVLKAHVSNDHLAKYAAALSLVGLVTQAAGLFTGAVAPYIARQLQLGDLANTSRLLRVVTLVTLVVTGSIALFLMAFGAQVVPLVLGQRYSDTGPLLGLLSISAVAIASGTANMALQIDTNGRFGLFANLAGFAILSTMSLVLVPAIGTAGAGYGRVAAQSVIGLLTFWRLRRVPGQEVVSKDLLRAFVLTLALTAITSAALNYAPAIGGRVAILGLALACLWGGCLWTTKLRISDLLVRIAP